MRVEISDRKLLKLADCLGADVADDHRARAGCNEADEPIKDRARNRQREDNGNDLRDAVEINVSLADDKVDAVSDEDGDIVRHDR